MADDPKPDEGDDGDEPKETPEEIKAQRDEYKRRLDRQRTAKAREARAAKREPKPDDKDAVAAAEALAAKDARIAELESKNNKTQAINIAGELGFKRPATAVKLVEWDELVDPGDPDEVRAALREVAKDNPELKKPPAKADGGEGQGDGQGGRKSFNDVIRRAAGRA